MLRRTTARLAATAAGSTLLSTHGPFRLLADQKLPSYLTIEIQGASRANLMDGEFMEGLLSVTGEIDGMDTARVAVLRAADGHHFCAGLDLKKAMDIFMRDVSSVQKLKAAVATTMGSSTVTVGEALPGMPAMRNMDLHKLIKVWQDAVSSLARCRVPIIAAVDKSCVGGGCDLATACDMRFSTNDAKFSIREAKVGIVADIGSLQRLSGIVGEGVARELSYTARFFDGAEAAALRFVNKSFATSEEMLAHADNVAREIAGNSPIAVQGTKEVFKFQTERAVQDSLDRVRLWNAAFLKSDDLVRAGIAFAAKHEPVFCDHVVDSRSAFPKSIASTKQRQ